MNIAGRRSKSSKIIAVSTGASMDTSQTAGTTGVGSCCVSHVFCVQMRHLFVLESTEYDIAKVAQKRLFACHHSEKLRLQLTYGEGGMRKQSD